MTKRLEQVTDRQAALWEMKRRLQSSGTPEARERLAHLPEGPWITISTQAGAGGHELAAALGKRLDWQVFDKEILHAISASSHLREQVLSRLDNHAVGALEDYLAQMLVPDDPGQSRYAMELARLICTVGREGRAVFVGRGANWVLDAQYGLRVRAIAPFDERVASFAAAEGVASPVARRRLRADDADRAKFVHQIYRRDIEDPMGYDLTLNMGSLPLEAAVETVRAALGAKLGVST